MGLLKVARGAFVCYGPKFLSCRARRYTQREVSVAYSAAPRRLALAVAVLALLITSSACAVGRTTVRDPFGGSSARPRSGGGAAEIRIAVRNSNFNESVIYAVRPGTRRRLGRVQGASDGEFTMPWLSADQLRFEIDILASDRCFTRTVYVEPGQRLLVIIDSTSRQRSDGVRRMCDVQRGR